VEHSIFRGLKELFRLKPVLSWGVSGVSLGVSTAIYQYGFNLNWFYLFLSALCVIIIQAFLAHSVNDLFDEEIDRKAPIKETGRVKVLIEGIMSRKDLVFISFISLLLVVGIVVYLTQQLGWVVLALASVGLYSAIAYSLPPLRLGWRPLSELTVVLPALTTLVVGVNFVATGNLSLLSFLIGVVFAFANIVWFIISRAQDFEADREMGKNTTVVLAGLDNLHPLLLYYSFCLVILSVSPALVYGLYWFPILISIMVLIYVTIFDTFGYDEKSIANARLKSIFLVSAWSLIVSLIFATGVM
jgi:1,4-dihydroxy-2-naphthoate octaprenyltransferase